MPGDVQVAGGIGPAPQEYEVPNATEIIPKAIRATFNGAAAGTAFFPTVEIVSDGGVVVASVPTDTSVAAGGSASVTFAPFLRTPGGATSGVSSITSTGGTITVTNPGGPVVNVETTAGVGSVEYMDATTGVIASGASGALAASHNSGATLLDYSTPTAPTFLVSGVYAVSGTVYTGEGIQAGGYVESSLSIGITSSFQKIVGAPGLGQWWWPLALFTQGTLGGALVLGYANHDAIAHTIFTTAMAVVKLG